jgi:hypothetical protein
VIRSGKHEFELSVTNAINKVSRDTVIVWVVSLSPPFSSTSCFIGRPCIIRYTANGFATLPGVNGIAVVEGDALPAFVVGRKLPVAISANGSVPVLADSPYMVEFAWTPTLNRFAAMADGAMHPVSVRIIASGVTPEVRSLPPPHSTSTH